MIPLRLSARAEASTPFVTRLNDGKRGASLVAADGLHSVFAGDAGLFEINGVAAKDMAGDVILVDPRRGIAERLFRSGSVHNSLLVTERCDQLCVMCSQPPKKTHHDRFDHFEAACLLADENAVVGITGGEPTLYKERLFQLIERVLAVRTDLSFHVLTNGQHFDETDVERLRQPCFRAVQWGVPLYSSEASLHDDIVGKPGAHRRLLESLPRLMRAGAHVELRTVLLTTNAAQLPTLARFVSSHLRFVDAWSIMQLENIGFARNRWAELYYDHRVGFQPIAEALDISALYGVNARLFNFARCGVPGPYRSFAKPSISDWKRRFPSECVPCRERQLCAGFFEWHPNGEGVTPL